MKKITNKIALVLFLVFLTFSCSTPEIEQNQIQEQTAQVLAESTLSSRAQNVSQPAPVTTTYTVKQYIFQRPAAAFGAGHVGVGFEVRTYTNGAQSNITYYYGAVENGAGSPIVLPGGNNGGWSGYTATGANMFSIMKNTYGYVNYKFKAAFTNLSATQRNNAYAKLANFPNRGYVLATNNCMNACWDVLWELGTSNVAWVENNYLPNSWYNKCTNGWSGSYTL